VVAAEQSSDPPGEAATATESVDRTTVRVTDHVGTILGTDDREYTLRQEDVVTLPAANAEALLSRDAAVELE
jgi:DNA replication factor GINS